MAQSVRNALIPITTTSTQVAAERVGSLIRKQIIIVNNSTAETVTIVFGDAAAVANQGIVLLPNGGAYSESTDSGFICWDGAIQAISTGSSNLSVVERFDTQ
jgi:hypothetical protein